MRRDIYDLKLVMNEILCNKLMVTTILNIQYNCINGYYNTEHPIQLHCNNSLFFSLLVHVLWEAAVPNNDSLEFASDRVSFFLNSLSTSPEDIRYCSENPCRNAADVARVQLGSLERLSGSLLWDSQVVSNYSWWPLSETQVTTLWDSRNLAGSWEHC